jgi:transketolase
MKRIGVKDKFGISGSPDELLERFEMKATHIAKAVKEVIERKHSCTFSSELGVKKENMGI